MFWQRRMRGEKVQTGVEDLVGATGEVQSGSPPRATSASWVSSGRLARAPSFLAGARVRVVAVHGLMLEVEASDEEATTAGDATRA